MKPLIAFTAARARTGRVAAFQRRAVLEPLTGPAADDGQVVAHTLRLVAMWRARVRELARAGYFGRRLGASAADAMNCHPLFIVARPRARRYGWSEACPSCWARTMVTRWHVVDRALCRVAGPTGSPPRRRARPRLVWQPDRDLIEWTASFAFPSWYDDPETGWHHPMSLLWLEAAAGPWRARAIEDFLGTRGAEHLFEALGLTIEGDLWRATIRRFLVAWPGVEAPAGWEESPEGGAVARRLVRPTRAEVLGAMAGALVYPRAVLAHEDVGAVVRLLDVLRDHRLRPFRAARPHYGAPGRAAAGRG